MVEPPAVADDAGAIGIDVEGHDRIAPTGAVVVQVDERVAEGMPELVHVVEFVGIGDVEALIDQLPCQVSRRLRMARIAESLVVWLAPNVGPGLAAKI